MTATMPDVDEIDPMERCACGEPRWTHNQAAGGDEWDGHDFTPAADRPRVVRGELVTGHEVERYEGRSETRTGAAIVPMRAEMRGLAEMAVTLSAANALPSALRQKPADVFLVLLTARDLGVALTVALREFHVIDGKVTLSPKSKLAMVRQSGLGRVWPHQGPRELVCPRLDARNHGEKCPLCLGVDVVTKLCACGNDQPDNGAEVATWHADRTDTPGVLFTSTVTHAEAEAITFDTWEGPQNARRQVSKKLTDKDNWRNYPARMLNWRSVGYLLDDAFSEVATGLYNPDELGAVTDEDGRPLIDLDSTEALMDTRPGHHKRRAPAASGTPTDDGPSPEDPADPADLEALRLRIAALAVNAAALAFLKDLWVTPDRETGQPRLPNMDHLRRRHLTVAQALVADVEKRAKRGEWGTWPPEPGDVVDATATEPDPEPPAGPTETAPQEPAGESPAPTPEPEAGDVPAPQEAPDPAPAATSPDDAASPLVVEITARVEGMDLVDVDRELGERSIAPRGDDRTRRLRLAQALYLEASNAPPVEPVQSALPVEG